MGAMAIGTVLGFILGAAYGSQAFAFAGAVIGLTVGVAVYGFGWIRARAGDSPTIEHHRILCTPHGQVADCEVEGDTSTGRWYNVRSCSLLSPADDVYCSKTCLKMINDNGAKPGQACDCGGH